MILTIGALVRAFAGMIMPESMSVFQKRLAVIGAAVVLTVAYSISVEATTYATMFNAVIGGLVAGLTALGIYHVSDNPSEVK